LPGLPGNVRLAAGDVVDDKSEPWPVLNRADEPERRPAEGARGAWRDVPQPVRAAVERVCGSSVVEALTQPGGFSPGVAARVRCADGRRFFTKAAPADVNADAPRLRRQEARVLAGLDPLIIARCLALTSAVCRGCITSQ